MPPALNRLINFLDQLPGIGPKSAARLALYLLQTPQQFRQQLGESIAKLSAGVKACSVCFNLDDRDPCRICSDADRDRSQICVVEQVLDVLALERTGRYHGLYHVLGGAINPMAQIGPDQLHIAPLLKRVAGHPEVKEIILATNLTLEGDATALYLRQQLDGIKRPLKITRIGHGLPMGADLDYADPETLSQAMEGRRELE